MYNYTIVLKSEFIKYIYLEVYCMRYNKLKYIIISVLLFFSFINILVCFDILPFDAMRVGLIVTSFGSVFLLSKKKNINSQNSKMSIAGCCTLLIWTISIFTAFFIQK